QVLELDALAEHAVVAQLGGALHQRVGRTHVGQTAVDILQSIQRNTVVALGLGHQIPVKALQPALDVVQTLLQTLDLVALLRDYVVKFLFLVHSTSLSGQNHPIWGWIWSQRPMKSR